MFGSVDATVGPPLLLLLAISEEELLSLAAVSKEIPPENTLSLTEKAIPD